MTVLKIPFKKQVALRLFNVYRNNETRLHRLNYLMWECTLRCNLSCLHCGSDCKKDASVSDMPVSDFLKVVDQITPIVEPGKTMIVFTGGEPLLRNDLETAGYELYKRGFPWGLVTNGLLLQKGRLESLMNSGLRSVTVSLDGLEKSHNWLRGNDKSFKSALHALELLSCTDGLRYDVVSCISQKNFEEIEALRELLIRLKISDWRIFTIFPTGRAKHNKILQLNAVQFTKLFEFIVKTRETGKINLSYGCEGFLGNYEGAVRDHFFFCRAGINIGSVLADGSISACPNLRNNFIQGNIYHDDFAEIWENKFRLFRERSWTKIGICANCRFYKYCLGNGLHLRNEKTGELMFCHLNRIREGEVAIQQRL